VYSVAATSAVPLSVFTGYTMTTFGGLVAVSGTIVAFVQGGFVVFGLFVLSWFLLAAFIVSVVASFWYVNSTDGQVHIDILCLFGSKETGE
jgi:hypothetical protein